MYFFVAQILKVTYKFMKKFLKILQKWSILSVSKSVSAHEIGDLSAGRTRTVRVRYAHPYSAGFW